MNGIAAGLPEVKSIIKESNEKFFDDLHALYSNKGMKKIITVTNHVNDWVPIFGLYRIAIVAKIKPKV